MSEFLMLKAETNIQKVFDRPSSLTRGKNHFQFVLHNIFLREEDGTWLAEVSYMPLGFIASITRESRIHRWENESDSEDVRFCVEILTFRGPENRDVYPDSFFRYPKRAYEYISLFDDELDKN